MRSVYTLRSVFKLSPRCRHTNSVSFPVQDVQWAVDSPRPGPIIDGSRYHRRKLRHKSGNSWRALSASL